MNNDEDFLLEDIGEAEDDNEAYEAAKALIRERCRQANIKTEDKSATSTETDWLTIYMPAGRQQIPLYVPYRKAADALLSIQFEKYRLLGDYMGICSYADRTIEASVRPVGTRGDRLPPHYRRRLFGNGSLIVRMVPPTSGGV